MSSNPIHTQTIALTEAHGIPIITHITWMEDAENGTWGPDDLPAGLATTENGGVTLTIQYSTDNTGRHHRARRADSIADLEPGQYVTEAIKDYIAVAGDDGGVYLWSSSDRGTVYDVTYAAAGQFAADAEALANGETDDWTVDVYRLEQDEFVSGITRGYPDAIWTRAHGVANFYAENKINVSRYIGEVAA